MCMSKRKYDHVRKYQPERSAYSLITANSLARPKIVVAIRSVEALGTVGVPAENVAWPNGIFDYREVRGRSLEIFSITRIILRNAR
jgi:hypothetical protein